MKIVEAVCSRCGKAMGMPATPWGPTADGVRYTPALCNECYVILKEKKR